MTHRFDRLDVDDRRAAPTGQPAQVGQVGQAYVERGGEIVTRHPFDASGVRLFAFPLEGDPLQLSTLCDRLFADPTGGRERYTPVGRHVLLTFTDISSLRSAEPPDEELGTIGERELAVWMPIYDEQRGRAAWTIPYLFVDASAPLLGGREIYGFPKQLGTVTMPEDADNPSAFEVHAPCIRRFAPESRVAAERVVRVSRDDAQPLQLMWSDLGRVVTELASWFGDDTPVRTGGGLLRRATDLAADLATRGDLRRYAGEARPAAMLISQLAQGSVPVVLLKQFRDAADPDLACYQAVVEVEHRARGFNGGGLLGRDWQVEVDDLDGVAIVRDLGLRHGPHRPGPAFWLDFEFRIERGTVLWEAGR